MQDKDDIVRNRPSDEGKRNDPNVRDEDGRQPGVNTMSSSDSDAANQDLTKTGGDNFSTDADFGKNADPKFDEIGEED